VVRLSDFFQEYLIPSLVVFIGLKVRPMVYEQYSSKLRVRDWVLVLTPVINFLMALFMMGALILIIFIGAAKFFFEGNK
jgi:hypothetical protein